MSSQAAPHPQADAHSQRQEVATLELEAASIDHGAKEISVGNYLLARLEQLGVTVKSSVHFYF
jgi:hypothetical protein